jgi:hypothetical protein
MKFAVTLKPLFFADLGLLSPELQSEGESEDLAKSHLKQRRSLTDDASREGDADPRSTR